MLAERTEKRRVAGASAASERGFAQPPDAAELGSEVEATRGGAGLGRACESECDLFLFVGPRTVETDKMWRCNRVESLKKC